MKDWSSHCQHYKELPLYICWLVDHHYFHCKQGCGFGSNTNAKLLALWGFLYFTNLLFSIFHQFATISEFSILYQFVVFYGKGAAKQKEENLSGSMVEGYMSSCSRVPGIKDPL